jgi:hypothetical protein
MGGGTRRYTTGSFSRRQMVCWKQVLWFYDWTVMAGAGGGGAQRVQFRMDAWRRPCDYLMAGPAMAGVARCEHKSQFCIAGTARVAKWDDDWTAVLLGQGKRLFAGVCHWGRFDPTFACVAL